MKSISKVLEQRGSLLGSFCLGKLLDDLGETLLGFNSFTAVKKFLGVAKVGVGADVGFQGGYFVFPGNSGSIGSKLGIPLGCLSLPSNSQRLGFSKALLFGSLGLSGIFGSYPFCSILRRLGMRFFGGMFLGCKVAILKHYVDEFPRANTGDSACVARLQIVKIPSRLRHTLDGRKFKIFAGPESHIGIAKNVFANIADNASDLDKPPLVKLVGANLVCLVFGNELVSGNTLAWLNGRCGLGRTWPRRRWLMAGGTVATARTSDSSNKENERSKRCYWQTKIGHGAQPRVCGRNPIVAHVGKAGKRKMVASAGSGWPLAVGRRRPQFVSLKPLADGGDDFTRDGGDVLLAKLFDLLAEHFGKTKVDLLRLMAVGFFTHEGNDKRHIAFQ